MKRYSRTLVVLLMVAGAGCHRQTDVEKVPVGTEVDVTKQDGGVVHGKLAERDKNAVRVDVGQTQRTVPRDQIADVRVVDRNSAEPPALPAIARFREVTLPEGTRLGVRLNDTVSSESNRVEDRVDATVIQPVLIGEMEVVPAGSHVKGEVASVEPAGKVKGRASLALRFRTLEVEGGDSYTIAARVAEMAPATKGEDAAKIGIPAAGGAVIGGLIGGKKGAAIGAGVGGGAGTAAVLATPGKDVVLPKDSVLSLRLQSPVDIKVPIHRDQH